MPSFTNTDLISGKLGQKCVRCGRVAASVRS
jgi:hypothetical protein